MTRAQNSPDADLRASAPFAWELAPRTCRVDPQTGESCSAVHGAWQYLRLLGIVGTIDFRAKFYVDALRSLAPRSGGLRVLVSGAADHAMLDFVLSALGDRQPAITVTVVDLCETPLAVNRRYAERHGRAIETARCDIFEYAAPAPFDAVCTDSFFGRFPAAARPALAAKWHALLRPGGKVITANALRPASTPERMVFSPEQVQAVRSAALHAASRLRDTLPVASDALAQAAAAYARQHVTFSVRSAAEIRALLEGAGFAVSELGSLRVSPAGSDSGAGPSVKRRNAEFLTIIAARR